MKRWIISVIAIFPAVFLMWPPVKAFPQDIGPIELNRQVKHAGSVEVEQRLASHAPIDGLYDSPLRNTVEENDGLAVDFADFRSVRRLSDERQNGRWKDGWDALMWAAYSGNSKQVSELIQARANLNIQDYYGYSALMLAAWKGHADVAHLLINAGASLSLRNWNSDPILSIAAIGGSMEIVHELIEKHVNPNDANSGGQTPLMLASFQHNFPIVDYLMKHGANPNLKDCTGDTAYDYKTKLYQEGQELNKESNKKKPGD